MQSSASCSLMVDVVRFIDASTCRQAVQSMPQDDDVQCRCVIGFRDWRASRLPAAKWLACRPRIASQHPPSHRADQDRLTRPRAPLPQGRRQAKPTAPTAAPARPCTGVARRRRLPAPTPVGAFFFSVRMHRSAMQASRGDERQGAITTISRPLDEPEYVVRITVVAGHSSPPRAFRLGVFSACVPSRTANACRRSVMARRLSVAVPPRADTPPVRHESPASSAGDSS